MKHHNIIIIKHIFITQAVRAISARKEGEGSTFIFFAISVLTLNSFRKNIFLSYIPTATAALSHRHLRPIERNCTLRPFARSIRDMHGRRQRQCFDTIFLSHILQTML